MRYPTRRIAHRNGDYPVLALEPDGVARNRLVDGLRLGPSNRFLDGVRFDSGWREIDHLPPGASSRRCWSPVLTLTLSLGDPRIVDPGRS